MRKDRQRQQTQTRSLVPSQGQEYDDPLNRIRRMAGQLKHYVPPDEARGIQEMVDKVEEIAAYDAMRSEIEAAGHALEAHRAEFEQMMRDLESTMDRARQLFSEERFAHLRYTVADVHRAFDAVGYPARFQDGPSDENMDILLAATLYLADDKDLRHYLTRQLMMMLPEYVSAGRYLDGWLIQHSAFRMTEKPDESNLFLFVMFTQAFEEWVHLVDGQQGAALREMGVNPETLSNMSIEEAEARLQTQMTDPTTMARLEAYYDAHPMLHAQTRAEVMELERNAVSLLERDDAECLHLSQEEAESWLPVLMERLQPLEIQLGQTSEKEDEPDPVILEEMQKTFINTTFEMAAEIFTPERIAQLVVVLKDYRSRLHEAGQREATTHAHGALLSVTREDLPPAENRFLAVVCYASLRALMRTLAENRPGDEG